MNKRSLPGAAFVICRRTFYKFFKDGFRRLIGQWRQWRARHQ